jgi:PilZ domain
MESTGGRIMTGPFDWWLGGERESDRELTTALDRRSEERYPLALRPRVRFMVKPSFENYCAAVADISPHGLALVICKAVPEGAIIAIDMPGIELDRSVVRIGTVKYVAPLVGASWLIGCQTEQDLTDTDAWQLANEQALTGVPIDLALFGEV